MKTTRTGQQWLADIGAILVLAGVLALVGMVVQTCRIMASPATATGVVESKRMIEGKGENSDQYHLRYSFSVISGSTYHGEAEVSAKIYDRTSVGDPIEVQYASDDPGNNRVIGDTGNPLALESALAAVTFLVMFV